MSFADVLGSGGSKEIRCNQDSFFKLRYANWMFREEYIGRLEGE